MDCEISLGNATSSIIVGSATPREIVADIKAGTWHKQVAAVRAATGEERDRLKKFLPAVLWSGTFNKRANAGLVKRSGLICADLDKLPGRIEELHNIARSDESVLTAFVSPSGDGLKIVFRADSFVDVRYHVAQCYKAKVDESAKDVARLCFVSSDPAAFYNPTPVVLASAPAEVLPLIPASVAPDAPDQQSGSDIGGRNNGAFMLACRCRDARQVTAFAADQKPPLPVHEALACVRSAYSQAPRPPVVALPELIDAADFLATPIEQPAELVAGVLHRGSKLAFGGSSKSYKTWVLLDLALSVANGMNWLGHPTAQGKVLFLNFEMQEFAWQRRIESVARAKGSELKAGRVILWNLRGYAADFGQIIPRIIQRCRAENFALIVLDPIYKLYGNTDENSAGNVALLLNSLEGLAKETGAAIAFGAHFAKGNASGKEAIDRISGSGVFARDPDSLLIFTKHEEDDAFTVESILRNFAPVAPFAVRWQFPLMQTADDLDPAKLKQVVGRKRVCDPKKLLTVIAETTPQTPISISAWGIAGKVPRQTLTEYLPEMRRNKWIKTVGVGNTARQFITNVGKAFLYAN